MAVLTIGLRNLERQLDVAFPHRIRPDGWIGDRAHQQSTSGHNPDDTPGSRPAWDGDPDSIPEVRALDIATNLGDGYIGQQLVDHLIALPRLDTVIRYLIHRGHIYHERNNFRPVPFDGDPHTDHVHAEGAWSQSADNNGSFNYHLEDLVQLTDDNLRAIAQAVWAYQLEDPTSTTTPRGTKSAGAYQRYVDIIALGTREAVTDELKPEIDKVRDDVAALRPPAKP